MSGTVDVAEHLMPTITLGRLLHHFLFLLESQVVVLVVHSGQAVVVDSGLVMVVGLDQVAVLVMAEGLGLAVGPAMASGLGLVMVAGLD